MLFLSCDTNPQVLISLRVWLGLKFCACLCLFCASGSVHAPITSLMIKVDDSEQNAAQEADGSQSVRWGGNKTGFHEGSKENVCGQNDKNHDNAVHKETGTSSPPLEVRVLLPQADYTNNNDIETASDQLQQNQGDQRMLQNRRPVGLSFKGNNCNPPSALPSQRTRASEQQEVGEEVHGVTVTPAET
jgi:hypothetical protein